MGKMKPSTKGNDKLKAEQRELARKQREQIDRQKQQLRMQEMDATDEAEKARQQRISGQRAQRNSKRGRSSLISTGSELGTSSQLG
jgi:transcription elongation GreA/GreB family factor